MIRANFIIFLLLACMPLRSQVQQFFSSDSLASITSPLGVDSLFYWFDAGAGVTDSLGGAIATDEGVGTWNDQSGNGYHVTQTTNTDRPVYKATGGPGSKPCIQFDGSDDFLASAAHFWGSDDITVFVVMKWGNATRNADESVITKYTATTTYQWAFEGRAAALVYDLVFYAFKDGTTTNYKRNNGPDNGKHTTWKLHAWTNTPPTVTLFTDATSVTIANQTVGTGDNTIYNSSVPAIGIGCGNAAGTPNNFLQGSVSEIIVYSKALSATERAAIENYLNKKYDLY